MFSINNQSVAFRCKGNFRLVRISTTIEWADGACDSDSRQAKDVSIITHPNYVEDYKCDQRTISSFSHVWFTANIITNMLTQQISNIPLSYIMEMRSHRQSSQCLEPSLEHFGNSLIPATKRVAIQYTVKDYVCHQESWRVQTSQQYLWCS